jgi:NADH-quinone oxidoreductase subunit G
MPQLTIDGKVYTYEADGSLLAFALAQEVEIPYFCYHPAMSTPTNCRMCLVNVGFPMKDRATGQAILDDQGQPKIAWGRKPATACNQALAPDMVVQTGRTSPVIKKAQEGVLEFLLINHPLDCPICDQAGECPLQIWTYKYGPEGSRFESHKVHKPKEIDLGPNVKLDAERCINCTRCTRFTEEISGSNQLSIHSRGVSNYPATAPGKTFDDPYSMNVIDICPVGALTSRDFRFKARVWEMNYTPTVCTGCSNGCNVDVWVRDNQVLRQTPRENPAVNQHWMCDEGRLDYPRFNEGRVSGAKLKTDLPISFEEGMQQAAALLRKHGTKTLFIGSAHASVESNHALKVLAAGFGSAPVVYANHTQVGWGDSFLRKDDRTPNAAGCNLLGFNALVPAQIAALVASGDYEMVYALEDNGLMAQLVSHFQKLPFVVHATNYFSGHEHVAVLLPAATHLEANGVYVNAKQTPQLALQALQIRRMTPEMWMGLPKSRIDAGGVPIDNWRSPENIHDCLPSWLLLSKLALELGIDFVHTDHKTVFEALRATYPTLAHLKLQKRGRKEAFKMSQFEFALP